ncbi:rhamnogalacturonan acetylesterase [Gracilibacillus sp. S3-1-1]|uniref:Rhamnogalacturonan acetylesterase n=1 Tax=Gracilibacillus pellucidus TaxID=3095368 RepID=A0ACC6M2L9_9BACI|nr:rhamnogalacturonan acetylesterase [Gracilibacillus sp. S3-1-1]MDX8045169.1 rhamnogalacturonan acetylesterase [Gracilibacillus sp. S3-1-1]
MGTQLFLAGDSTMAIVESSRYPQMGWGQTLADYFTDEIIVRNHAASGRSTKSFIDEGRWDEMERAFHPGDYVLIQFGHNDQKKDEERATQPFTSYQHNLHFFIQCARSAGVIPILLTSIARRHFNETGHLVETHGDYPQAMKELAVKEEVLCIDMLSITSDALRNQGDEASKKWFMRLAAGEYNNYPDGIEDDTHLHELGARAHCQLFVQALLKINHPLASYVKRSEVSL